MTLTEPQDSIRRVLGADLPREIRFGCRATSSRLGRKLAAAIHGWAPAGLLVTYHGERHLAGARALPQTRAQVALGRGHDPAAEALRDVFRELLVDEQPLRRMGALTAGTDIRYPSAHP